MGRCPYCGAFVLVGHWNIDGRCVSLEEYLEYLKKQKEK